MRVQWGGRRLDVPAWSPVPGGVVVHTDVALPFARLDDRHGGWVVEATPRKVATFLAVEGPVRTLRKVNAKRAQRGYLGDWRVTLVLGRRADDGTAVVALAPRAPAWAEAFLVPEQLVAPIDEGCGARDVRVLAERLRAEVPDIADAAHERFLYSGNPVPPGLVDAFARITDPRRPTAASAPTVAPQSLATLVAVARRARRAPSGLPLALLGCGDYASTELLPALLHDAHIEPWVAADREPHVAMRAARRHGFALASTDAEEAIDALPGPGVVMVATAHDSHARLAAAAAAAGHAVFVEKPPVVTDDDLALLVDAWCAAPGRIEIGFNRRYAPLTRRAMRLLNGVAGPTTVTAIVKEIPIKPAHWFLWPNQGTRVAGNLCHWLDLATYVIGSAAEPVEVAVSPWVGGGTGEQTAEERTISVTFADGSLTTIVATVRGDATRGVQERVEIRRPGMTLDLDDFRTLRSLVGGRRRLQGRAPFRNKGHTAMYRSWATQVAEPRPARYPLRDLVVVSVLQLAATELVRTGRARIAVADRLDTYRSVLDAAKPVARPRVAALIGL